MVRPINQIHETLVTFVSVIKQQETIGKIKKSSTNCINWETYIIPCDLTYSVSRIGGRWKLPIMSKLEGGKLRFGELRDSITGITERMLSLQLKELEKEMLIKRTVYPEAPPKVEYALTDIAKELIPIWRQLEAWGARHKEVVKANTISQPDNE